MFEASENTVYKSVKQKYIDYLELYKLFNDGSTQGAVEFPDFYWRYTYYFFWNEENQAYYRHGR